MSIFYLMIEASPTIENREYDDVGGVFVNCWVKAYNSEDSLSIVENTLLESHWNITKIHDHFLVDEKAYSDNPESLAYIKYASDEGAFYIFNGWPNEPQEGDTIH